MRGREVDAHTLVHKKGMDIWRADTVQHSAHLVQQQLLPLQTVRILNVLTP